jgi:hypothetical protein
MAGSPNRINLTAAIKRQVRLRPNRIRAKPQQSKTETEDDDEGRLREDQWPGRVRLRPNRIEPNRNNQGNTSRRRTGHPKKLTVFRGGSPFQEPGDQENAHDLGGYQGDRQRLMALAWIDHGHQQKR